MINPTSVLCCMFTVFFCKQGKSKVVRNCYFWGLNNYKFKVINFKYEFQNLAIETSWYRILFFIKWPMNNSLLVRVKYDNMTWLTTELGSIHRVDKHTIENPLSHPFIFSKHVFSPAVNSYPAWPLKPILSMIYPIKVIKI